MSSYRSTFFEGEVFLKCVSFFSIPFILMFCFFVRFYFVCIFIFIFYFFLLLLCVLFLRVTFVCLLLLLFFFIQIVLLFEHPSGL